MARNVSVERRLYGCGPDETRPQEVNSAVTESGARHPEGAWHQERGSANEKRCQAPVGCLAPSSAQEARNVHVFARARAALRDGRLERRAADSRAAADAGGDDRDPDLAVEPVVDGGAEDDV